MKVFDIECFVRYRTSETRYWGAKDPDAHHLSIVPHVPTPIHRLPRQPITCPSQTIEPELLRQQAAAESAAGPEFLGPTPDTRGRCAKCPNFPSLVLKEKDQFFFILTRSNSARIKSSGHAVPRDGVLVRACPESLQLLIA
jgi:hypothetical protein